MPLGRAGDTSPRLPLLLIRIFLLGHRYRLAGVRILPGFQGLLNPRHELGALGCVPRRGGLSAAGNQLFSREPMLRKPPGADAAIDERHDDESVVVDEPVHVLAVEYGMLLPAKTKRGPVVTGRL